ncbi:hypothetical protein [Effusibacillus pohliae]|uniref:hypothetical protein n=1 Tax=Effusibacillus pohliae TaxID=232270 RepID=UPI0003796D03|nr:hypothetical protein [Effusibacillus pohliae]
MKSKFLVVILSLSIMGVGTALAASDKLAKVGATEVVHDKKTDGQNSNKELNVQNNNNSQNGNKEDKAQSDNDRDQNDNKSDDGQKDDGQNDDEHSQNDNSDDGEQE